MSASHDVHTFGDFDVSVVVTAPPYYENCYVVRHRVGGEQLLIDPGSDAARILAKVDADGGGLNEILLTHGHPDHIGGVCDIQDAMPVPCRAHIEEDVVMRQAPSFATAMGQGGFRGVSSCDYFTGEPTLSFSGANVRVIHTPGHTPGGVCYVFDGFAFTGDTLFNQGVGRTDFPGGDSTKLHESITRLLAEIPEDTVLFSGHGPQWTASEASRWWRMVAF
ncbi:MAG: MBL fold metallo-hydrolase [Rhodospirillales bacterium]|nr:MBL fold metallo-hydrolase [Rhodospirillales bacterium]MCW9002312.1 MBL fold metallo-hydrolase [Rhodospirillales bacterium]